MQLTTQTPPPPHLPLFSSPFPRRSAPNRFPLPLLRSLPNRLSITFASKYSSPLLAEDGSDLPDEDSFEYDYDYDDDEEEDEEEDDEKEEELAADDYELDVSDGGSRYQDSSEELEAADVSPLPLEKSKSKSTRVEKLCGEAREFGADFIDVHELASVYDFRIDKFQRLAIEAFLRGSSVVVSAPTSSGKTLIAEAASVATVARGRRLFYTTPLKALSNQKFREFRETFGDAYVGLLTGDSAVNKDAQIVIMTTEILRNMMYQSVGKVSSGSGLLHLDVIVLDEVHYLSDISRGTVWEEIVIYCPKDIQLICLSATVANADELAGWIGQIHGKTELVTSSRRPVPLTWHFSTKSSLSPLLDEKGKGMNRKLSLNYQLYTLGYQLNKDDGGRRRNSRRRRNETKTYADGNIPSQGTISKNNANAVRRSLVPQVVDTLQQIQLRDMLPAIWFIFSRRGCDAAVQYVEGYSLLDSCEMSEVELALKRFRLQYPDAVRETALKGLMNGVAAHHAGCLPLWKSFIEELFQRGLIKVVFATETLAAGINMPARTTVLSSLSKRSSSGRISLTSIEMLQMAGRAGRRGIDSKGHVVLVQTAYEGAEECCKLLFAGIEPLVSQFTASYGMVLNLLAGSKLTSLSNESGDNKVVHAGRSLEEARKLVEQSFGNYVGSNVMLAAKEELSKIQKEIEVLSFEISDEAIDRKARRLMSDAAYKEIAGLQEELRAQKRIRTELRRVMESRRMSAVKHLLEELESGQLPFVCLQYKDSEGVLHSVPAVYLGKAESLNGTNLKNKVLSDDAFVLDVVGAQPSEGDAAIHENFIPAYHVALGSDNSWYLVTEQWIGTVYRTGLPNVALTPGDALPRELMIALLNKDDMPFNQLANGEFGGMWSWEGSLETWSWSLNVPVLNSLSEKDEALFTSQDFYNAVESYKQQRTKVARLKKKIARSEGFKEYKTIVDMTKFTEEKIRRLKARSKRLANRVQQIEPSGWKEFMQISQVIHEVRALDINTRLIFPLGETAAAIKGENELWLAIVLRNKILVSLKPPQLAGVCASFISEGIKVRPNRNDCYIYEPSQTVTETINRLDEQRSSLIQLQDKHSVQIPCCLDTQFSGMVEAWASGLTWREMMMDCAMDEGDLARLLRRTIDLLAQVPKLPDIDRQLQGNALAASNIMDRPPISELAG
ncbi:hypothetical protein MLD38_009377 [Melastoma candidum]|uniref:Uncharacterized protein n=1 Tax=Melastoma candidum TaxID=119954 RepID=A0ACB9RWI3_9MYRT|nr:hypothetical protein MLD38_009377 [Melastoma candidum]